MDSSELRLRLKRRGRTFHTRGSEEPRRPARQPGLPIPETPGDRTGCEIEHCWNASNRIPK